MASRPDVAFLRQVPIFKDVDEQVLIALWPSLRERRLRKGEVIFREGDPGDELFVIFSGSVVVSKPVTGRVEQVLNRLGQGEVFGEMSVFGDEQKRSATRSEVSRSRLKVNRTISRKNLAASLGLDSIKR